MNAREQIKAFEGSRRVAYLDTEGILTIGVGHTGPEVRDGMRWTNAQIDAAFALDLEEAEQACSVAFPWYPMLNEPRRAAICGMVFQMGLAGVQKFKNMLGAIRDERWQDAEGQALDSKWAKQAPGRAHKVARQLSTGEWQT